MNGIEQVVKTALGIDVEPQTLLLEQLCLRGFIVFWTMLWMIRLAGRRFLSENNPVDALLAFLIASLMARAINGSAAFFPSIGTGLFLALLYRALAYLTCQSATLGKLLKGKTEKLVQDGQVVQAALGRHHISQEDLLQELRLKAAVEQVSEVKWAQMERNGAVSVQRQSKILDVSVKDGVQTVRIEMNG